MITGAEGHGDSAHHHHALLPRISPDPRISPNHVSLDPPISFAYIEARRQLTARQTPPPNTTTTGGRQYCPAVP